MVEVMAGKFCFDLPRPLVLVFSQCLARVTVVYSPTVVFFQLVLLILVAGQYYFCLFRS
ncbi:hypothetical protein [Haloarcula marina]|uniref:hypothetical protein n=1 Tax=Haloarcula marina TaxID=2961574 RepID=UPI0020B7538D|nr:hypothetical protein [Halomicroarcula marina]